MLALCIYLCVYVSTYVIMYVSLFCMYCIVFIHFCSTSHSMRLSEALPTTEIDTVGVFSAEVLQATVSEGLAHGPYLAARAGFEPAPLRSKDIDSTNAPPQTGIQTYVCIYVSMFLPACIYVFNTHIHNIQTYKYVCIHACMFVYYVYVYSVQLMCESADR